METQPTLFDSGGTVATASARRTDPQSSHDAAADIEASGTAGSHRERIFAYLKQRGPMTSKEIAVGLGMERHAVARRLPELRTEGKVRNGLPRICRVVRKKVTTWEAIRADFG